MKDQKVVGAWTAVGVGVGVAIGAATGALALWRFGLRWVSLLAH